MDKNHSISNKYNIISGASIFSFGMIYYLLNHSKKSNKTIKTIKSLKPNIFDISNISIISNTKPIMVNSSTQTEEIYIQTQSIQTQTDQIEIELFIDENHFIDLNIDSNNDKTINENILDDWSVI